MFVDATKPKTPSKTAPAPVRKRRRPASFEVVGGRLVVVGGANDGRRKATMSADGASVTVRRLR